MEVAAERVLMTLIQKAKKLSMHERTRTLKKGELIPSWNAKMCKTLQHAKSSQTEY